MSKKPLPDIYQPLKIKWAHTDPCGFPMPTFENIQCVIDTYRVTLARDFLNADDFTPFFNGRYHAKCGEKVRDCHRTQLFAICKRNEMNVTLEQVERYVQLRGLEIEDGERRKANEKRLRAGGGL